MELYGGIEGGATHTVAVLLGPDGKVLRKAEGPGSNGWVIGVRKSAEVLIDLFNELKAAVGCPADVPLRSIGMCMSGFLQPRAQEELKTALCELSPGLCPRAAMYVDNDSPGSVFTAAGETGGAVIIAGTGSMAQVITREGKVTNAGGWGHMYGDEGSAYYIAAKAIRLINRSLDGIPTRDAAGAPLDTTAATAAMLRYFQIADRDGLLEVFYKDFSKDRIAGFAKELAEVAQSGDAFARSVFARAGKHLGIAARTLAPHMRPAGADPATTNVDSMSIAVVGSVWKSFDLFRDAFLAEATAPFVPGQPAHVTGLTLLTLTATSAIGAAWRGAKLAGVSLPVDFAANTTVLFELKP